MEDKYIMPEAGTSNSKAFVSSSNVQEKKENTTLSATEETENTDQIEMLKTINGKLDAITEMLQK